MDLNLPLSDSDRGKLQVHIHFEHLAPDQLYANDEAVAKASCLHFYLLHRKKKRKKERRRNSKAKGKGGRPKKKLPKGVRWEQRGNSSHPSPTKPSGILASTSCSRNQLFISYRNSCMICEQVGERKQEKNESVDLGLASSTFLLHPRREYGLELTPVWLRQG